MTCSHGELLAAARALSDYLSLSTLPPSTGDFRRLRSPADELRREADMIDARDAAIRRFRAALAACVEEEPSPLTGLGVCPTHGRFLICAGWEAMCPYCLLDARTRATPSRTLSVEENP